LKSGNYYDIVRKNFIAKPDNIVETERSYFQRITDALYKKSPNIKKDFDETWELRDFWFRYAPRQRGHKPRGTSLPWGEVGEKVLEAYLYQIASEIFADVSFKGLPYGHDVRFVTDNVFIQIDVKSTGPTDNPDEVVSSPNQVSGDGLLLDNYGVMNSKVTVLGPSRSMDFQPELPPFYISENKPLLTLTFYLKCVYKVLALGEQPLDYLEIVCVPNGMLMFDTYRYAETVQGLLTPGKDILTSTHKRTRIKLNPLSDIAAWRCQKIVFNNDQPLKIIQRKAE
jgi:hypothetical protein